MDFQGVNDPLRIDTSNQGGWAKLYLYAPQLYGTQVLRPFVYGFTEADPADRLYVVHITCLFAFPEPGGILYEQASLQIYREEVGGRVNIYDYDGSIQSDPSGAADHLCDRSQSDKKSSAGCDHFHVLQFDHVHSVDPDGVAGPGDHRSGGRRGYQRYIVFDDAEKDPGGETG